VPDYEPALRKRLGIAEVEKVGRNYQEALQYPSLNIRGMQSADIGPKARTIVPATAIAELDLRTVPETPPQALFELLKSHVEKQGFHVVKSPPTNEERARYPKLVSLELGGISSSGTAVRTELTAPIGQRLRRSFVKTYGKNKPYENLFLGMLAKMRLPGKAGTAPVLLIPCPYPAKPERPDPVYAAVPGSAERGYLHPASRPARQSAGSRYRLDRVTRVMDTRGRPDFAAIASSCTSITRRAGSSPSRPPNTEAGTRRLEAREPSS
jgi:hypothetical protein